MTGPQIYPWMTEAVPQKKYPWMDSVEEQEKNDPNNPLTPKPLPSLKERVSSFFNTWERKNEELESGMREGFSSGVGNLKRAAQLGLAVSKGPTNAAEAGEIFLRPSPEQEKSKSGFQTAGRFLGQGLVEAPVYMLGSAVMPEAKAASSLLRGAARAIPGQVVSNLATDAVLHGKESLSPGNLAMTALGAGLGSVMEGAQALGKFNAELARTSGPIKPTADLLEAVNEVHKGVSELVAYDKSKAPLLDQLNVVMDNIQRTGYDETRAAQLQSIQNQLLSDNAVPTGSAPTSVYPSTSPAQQVPVTTIVAQGRENGPQKLPGTWGANVPSNSLLRSVQSTHPIKPFGITADELDQKLFDKNVAFKKFGEDATTGQEKSRTAMALARRLSGTGAKIQQQIDEAIFVPTTGGEYVRSNAPTTRAILEKVGANPESLADWGDYQLGRAHLGGMDLGLDTPAVQAEVAALDVKYPHFRQLFDVDQKMHDDAIVEMMRGYGLTDAPNAQEMIQAAFYVPTQRDVTRTMTGKGTGLSFMQPKSNPSSLRAIRNPTQQRLEAEANLIRWGERNKVFNAVADAIKKDPDRYKGLYEINTAASAQPIEDEMQKLAAQYTQNGMQVPSRDVLRAQAIMSSSNLLDETASTIRTWKDGKMTEIKVDDPMFVDWLDASKINSQSTVGKVGRGAERGATRVFQMLRELTGKNALFDNFEAFYNNKLGEFAPGWDTAKGIKAILSNDPRLAEIKAYGGDVSGRYANPKVFAGATSYEKLVKEMQEGKGVGVHIMHPVKAIEEIMGVLSQSTRAGAALRKLESTMGDAAQAADMSRNVVADPQQMGSAQTIKLLANSAFANYSLQGLRRTIRAGQEMPKELAAKVAATIVAPAIGFWAHNRGDKDIEQLRKSKGGDLYHYIRNPQSGEILAIQKPPGPLSTFATAAEGALDAWADRDPTAATQFAKSFVNQLIPNPVPVTLGLGAEMAMGKNFMGLGAESIPLVPGSRSGMLAEDQGGINTLGSSRYIAEKLGVSAGQVDNLFRTILFSQGYDIADRVDRKMFNRSAPTTGFSVLPGVKIVSPERSNVRSTNKFYDDFGPVSEAAKSFALYQKTGDREGIMKIQQEYPDAIRLAPAYNAMNDWISKQRSLINMVEYNDHLSPADRREKIDRIQGMINQRTDMFNQLVSRFQKK